MRIVGFLLVLIMAITGCSDTARRQEVLSKSGELEVAWNNLDQECMATLDTLKITLKPWIPDTTGHAQRVFAGNDSLKKIFSGNLSRLEKEYSLYEQMLVTLKKNYHGFLSWQLLVNNEDIEIATASNDLKQHKQVFDSISVGAHAALRKSNAEISSFRYFIEKTSDSIIKDSLQNNLP